MARLNTDGERATFRCQCYNGVASRRQVMCPGVSVGQLTTHEHRTTTRGRFLRVWWLLVECFLCVGVQKTKIKQKNSTTWRLKRGAAEGGIQAPDRVDRDLKLNEQSRSMMAERFCANVLGAPLGRGVVMAIAARYAGFVEGLKHAAQYCC